MDNKVNEILDKIIQLEQELLLEFEKRNIEFSYQVINNPKNLS